MYNVLIIGFGNIGKHLYQEMSISPDISIDIYDKYKSEYSKTNPGKNYDAVFICVPTDSNKDGSCDTSIVESAIRDCRKLFGRIGVYVIKSTVSLGTTSSLQWKIGTDKIVYSPEYYGTTRFSPDSPNFLVVAGVKDYCNKVVQIYYKFKSNKLRVIFTDVLTAELAKYMENCFLATKVAFCAEFYEIAKQYGISYEKLREIFVLDERIGDSHTFIFEDRPFYDSHCLNKDIPALISQSKEAKLMSEVNRINSERKQKYDINRTNLEMLNDYNNVELEQ